MKKSLLPCLFAANSLMCMEVPIDLSKQGQLLAAIEQSNSKTVEEKNSGLEALRCLIKDDAVNLNFRYSVQDFATPLMLAVNQGNLEAAQLLCQEASVDPNIKNGWGAYPLHEAMNGANEAGLLMIRLLADKGALMDSRKFTTKETPLSLALNHLRPGLGYDIAPNRILALIALGADTRGMQIISFSPTHPLGALNLQRSSDEIFLDACFLGNKDNFLFPGCGHDVNPNTKDKIYGMTPLMWTAARGHSHLAKLLLTHPKIDVNAIDKFGDTAVHYAARNGHDEIVELLLNHPDIMGNLKNDTGKTPLALAKMRGHKAIGRILVNKVMIHNRALFLIFTRPSSRTAESSLPLLPADVGRLILYNQTPIGPDRRGIAKIIRLCKK